jgi:hypothetical protein
MPCIFEDIACFTEVGIIWNKQGLQSRGILALFLHLNALIDLPPKHLIVNKKSLSSIHLQVT